MAHILVLWHIILAVLLTYVLGFGLTWIFRLLFGAPARRGFIAFIVPVLGYVLSQLVFVGTYWLSFSAAASVGAVVSMSALLLVVGWFFSRFVKKGEAGSYRDLLPSRDDWIVIFGAAFILVLSCWVYVTLGEQRYYHSSNEDFFDGISGGNLYAASTPESRMPDGYTGDVLTQYSSIGFWRVILGLGGIDAFLIQANLNLLMSLFSIYWLARYMFAAEKGVSACVATFSIVGNFYFTTYLAGHIGSMMYMSVAPMFLGLLLSWGRSEAKTGWLLACLLIFLFLKYTYPGPINFILVPAILILLHERVALPFGVWTRLAGLLDIGFKDGRIKWPPRTRIWRLLLVVTVCAAVGITLLSFARLYLQDNKQYQLLLLRSNVSWQIAHEKEIIPIFWGIYPSNIVGGVSFLGYFLSIRILHYLLLSVSILLSIFAFLIGFDHLRKKQRAFLGLIVILYPAYYLMMTNFWGSPYYTYKFLYTGYFGVALAIGIWLGEHILSGRRLIRIFLTAVALFVVGTNVFWDFSRTMDIFKRPYHNLEKIQDFNHHVSVESLQSLAIDMPDETQTLAFTYLFRNDWNQSEQLRVHSQYLVQLERLRPVGYSDLGQDSVMYSNGLLRLVKRSRANRITLLNLYGTDNFYPMRISWIGNEITGLAVSLEQSVREMASYIKRAGIEDKTYLDIRRQHISVIVDRFVKSSGVALQLNPASSQFFIRQKFTRYSTFAYAMSQTVYTTTSEDRTVFENQFFRIVEVPTNGREVNSYIGQDLGRVIFPDLAKRVMEIGKPIYLDMPPFEQSTLFARQYLAAQGIALSPNSNVTTFLRLTMPPGLEPYDYQSVTSPNDSLIWDSPFEGFRKTALGMRLVNVPMEGRVRRNVSSLDSIKYRYLVAAPDADFRVSLQGLTQEAKYLRVVIAPGASIDFAPFNLVLHAPDGRVINRWRVSGATRCIDIPLDEAVVQSRVSSMLLFDAENVIGHSLLPYDDRLLNYGLLAVELTNRNDKYSDEILANLNPRIKLKYDLLASKLVASGAYVDIVDEHDKDQLYLGPGWYSCEYQDGRTFRWVNKSAEIIVRHPDEKKRFLNLEVEAGPAQAGNSSVLVLSTKESALGKYPLAGLQKVRIPLPRIPKEQLILRAEVDRDGVPIQGDPRLLDFRVFRAYLSER